MRSCQVPVQIQIGSRPKFLLENESINKWINQKFQLKRTERPCFYLHVIVCLPIHQTWSNQKLDIGKLDSLFDYSSINGIIYKMLLRFGFLRYRHDQWTESQSISGMNEIATNPNRMRRKNKRGAFVWIFSQTVNGQEKRRKWVKVLIFLFFKRSAETAGGLRIHADLRVVATNSKCSGFY